MASYRPISQNRAWRSAFTASMHISERYLEYYCLTSPFTNVIGCYQIVPGIVVAETGLSSIDELTELLAQLVEKGIIFYYDNFIVVKTWFHHNKWESALQGNVRKLAKQEIDALPLDILKKWVEATLQSGVPFDEIRSLVPSMFKNQESVLELIENKNVLDLEIELETTTKQQHKNSRRLSDCLDLVMLAEPHRALFSCALKDISFKDAQFIADEAGGALEAAARGERAPIGGLQVWLRSLISASENGTLTDNYAHKIVERRLLKIEEAKRVQEERNKKQENVKHNLESLKKTESLLKELDELNLQKLASHAAATIPSKKWKAEIIESILNRKIPQSHVCQNLVFHLAESWQSGEM